MAIDRTPNATQFSSSIVAPPVPVEVEPADDEGSENVASVQYMLRLFAQRNPQAYAAMNLTPEIVDNQIGWSEDSGAVFLPVIGADREQTQRAIDAWGSFIAFFNDNTTDQEYELKLYRPQQ